VIVARIDPNQVSVPGAGGSVPGELLYGSNKEGRWAIYRVRADGTGERRLTDTAADNVNGVWSPDGRSIAFVSERDGNSEIYAMNADGSGARRLTTAPGTDEAPAWSPDGRQLVFVSTRDGAGAVYLMDADGRNVVRLVNAPAGWPTWSRDGRIAFVRPVDGTLALFDLALDTPGIRRITDGGAWGGGGDDTPAYAPDGRLAFTSGPSKADRQIVTTNADGTNRRALTARGADTSNPVWSPDGGWLAYTSDSSGTQQVYVVRANGSEARAITSGAGKKWYLSWKP